MAFVAAYVFLARNGLRLVAKEVDAAQVVILLAADEIDKTAFSAWLRKNCESI
jgi:death-on-curing protein